MYEGKKVDYFELFKDKLCLESYPKEFNDYFLKNYQKYEDADYKTIQQLKTFLIQTALPGINSNKIKYYPHHQTHAFYGYYSSQFVGSPGPILVVTADSFGDFENGTISKFDNDGFEELHVVNNHNLGRIFRNMTLYLGMKPYEHEYKVMGLAAYANDYQSKPAYDLFASVMDVDGLDFVYNQEPPDNYFWYKERLEGVRFDAVAGGLQKYFEDRMVRWVKNAVGTYGIRRVVFSGGLAMNIKLNMQLAQLEEVEEFFVPATPDDNANSIGVCFRAMYEEKSNGNGADEPVVRLRSMYLGPDVPDLEITEAIEKNGLADFCEIVPDVTNGYLADRLTNGIVIGRCAGRMEFGARALGNRSILADPRDLRVVGRINRIIKKRDFWMPFAPVILDTFWDTYLVNPNGIFSPYMTVGFETTDIGQECMPAAIHWADKTTRPQMLTREANPSYYDIVDEFRKKTGVGALLNTSFNLHGYPIVKSAEDAIGVFLNTDLDALLLNGIYIEKQGLC